MEGIELPDMIPRMAELSERLVHERIIVCKAMGGLGCGEVWVLGLAMLNSLSSY